jgi:hypothetical protein
MGREALDVLLLFRHHARVGIFVEDDMLLIICVLFLWIERKMSGTSKSMLNNPLGLIPCCHPWHTTRRS